jgi:predicted hotdog family 3-hydroxylacyl-ACP dehydratase
MEEKPDLDDPGMLVPHSGPMLLLSRVLRHGGDETACAVEIAAQRLFREPDGTVPAWIGLEYMAQCVAVHAALARGDKSPPALGFLASVRGLRLHCERFEPEQLLEAVVRRSWGGDGGLSAFACRLLDAQSGALLAEGRISCFAPAAAESGK